MLKIDNSLLVDVGLGALPDPEKNSFLRHIYETLEMRVGIRLADQMSNEQLDEFEKYFEAKDDAGAFKWLETNFPNYKEIVQEEFDKLKAEVVQQAPQILAASQAQPGAAAAAEPQPAPVAPTQPADTAAQPAPTPQPTTDYQPPAPQPVAPPQPQFNNPIAPPPAAPPTPIEQPQPQTPPAAPQPPFPAEQPPAGPPPQQ
jgi:hypothetical protein